MLILEQNRPMRYIVLLFVVLAFTSCKEKKYCWICETTVTHRPGTPHTYGFPNQVCNKTENDIKIYESGHSYVTSDGSEEYVMTCKKNDLE
jgi:hypothetical protein